MVDMNTVRQAPTDLNDDEKRIWEEEARAMRALLASLPPPPLEGLARQQDVRIPQHWENLVPDWPEDEWDDEEDFDRLHMEFRAGEIEALRRKLAESPSPGMKPDDLEAYQRELWAMEVADWDREHAETSRIDKGA